MSWQQLRSSGDPIYLLEKEESWFVAKGMQRVIHHSTGDDRIKTKRCVRYKNRWRPLHEPEEWVPFLESCDAKGTKIYFDYPLVRKEAAARPFIMGWEEPGFFYQVYGY